MYCIVFTIFENNFISTGIISDDEAGNSNGGEANNNRKDRFDCINEKYGTVLHKISKLLFTLFSDLFLIFRLEFQCLRFVI